MLDTNIKALLPTIISDTMATLSALTNAPDEMTLPITLAVANFAAQAMFNVNPMQWRPCSVSEFFVVLTPSGGMKTSISSLLLDGIRDFEREQETENAQAMIDYKIKVKQFNKAIEDEAKNPTGINPKEPVRPKGSRYRVEKATVNGLINTLASVPFAGLFSSDAGEFFNSHSFQSSDKSMEMVATLSKAWSGEMIDRVTGIEENNVRLHNRRFNMLVLLQQELAGFLNNSQYKDQGFTNRMLITQCELFAKRAADFSEAGQLETQRLEQTLKPFNRRVYELLDDVDHKQSKARMQHLMIPGATAAMRIAAANVPVNAPPNELVLDAITFSSEDGAAKIMEEFCNEMGKESQNPKYSEYANFMSRAYEHACRLAATLAIFDKQDVIKAEYAMAGVELTRYFIEQRMNLSVDGSVKINPIVEAGNALLKWLAKQPNNEATKGHCSQSGPAIYKKMEASERLRVIQDLDARECIEIVERGVEEGKKATTYVKAIVSK
ncbi:DUF3987 domain-containing protein [Variovorax sp. J22R193]|uniref:DUF3987 domain-containing protein n=1 Tax=Variovorax fucosicus TaxID=3053517 RepID=UPI002575E22F|nr:DUF3987 domain-containing protein [Variovorax sp. J22R193]MDM0042163.1 DUF3987 domain-containing protein [Variovorax sp. J22R193]